VTGTARIRWYEDGALQVWSGFGHAGQAGAQLFTIAAPLPGSDSGYLLMSRLPGMEDFGCSRPRLEDAQAEAERWLEEFVSSLGASFRDDSDCSTITRFEVIDHTKGLVSRSPDRARAVVAHGVRVALGFQDDGRTLKVFVTDPDEPAKEAGQ
jgi:hypothetical protein